MLSLRTEHSPGLYRPAVSTRLAAPARSLLRDALPERIPLGARLLPARSPHPERCTEPHGGGDASPGASRKVLQSLYPSQCPSCCGDQPGESRGAASGPLLSSQGPTCATSKSGTCEERDTKMRTKPQFSPFSAENPAVGHRAGILQGRGCPPEYRQPCPSLHQQSLAGPGAGAGAIGSPPKSPKLYLPELLPSKGKSV